MGLYFYVFGMVVLFAQGFSAEQSQSILGLVQFFWNTASIKVGWWSGGSGGQRGLRWVTKLLDIVLLIVVQWYVHQDGRATSYSGQEQTSQGSTENHLVSECCIDIQIHWEGGGRCYSVAEASPTILQTRPHSLTHSLTHPYKRTSRYRIPMTSINLIKALNLNLLGQVSKFKNVI